MNSELKAELKRLPCEVINGLLFLVISFGIALPLTITVLFAVFARFGCLLVSIIPYRLGLFELAEAIDGIGEWCDLEADVVITPCRNALAYTSKHLAYARPA